ncbi:MAG: hypothetical protein AAFQ98_21140 [Bacteroidota bacterium]
MKSLKIKMKPTHTILAVLAWLVGCTPSPELQTQKVTVEGMPFNVIDFSETNLTIQGILASDETI